MAYTTCTFWIKFFTFFGVVGLVSSLFNAICPSCISTNMILAGVICSPILFANQIYSVIKREKSSSKSVSQVSNKNWLHENFDVFTNMYENMFVAVYNREIIDNDINLAPLKARILEQFKSLKNVYIEFINPKKIADDFDRLK